MFMGFMGSSPFGVWLADSQNMIFRQRRGNLLTGLSVRERRVYRFKRYLIRKEADIRRTLCAGVRAGAQL